MREKIEYVLEHDVRPQLLEHEGNVKIISYEDGILKIRLTGHCAGCPSAQLTTEEIISKVVIEKIPEVKDVVLINQISDELIEMARKVMKERRIAGACSGAGQ